MFDRDKAIAELVNNDINMIFSFKEQDNDEEYIAGILEFGFRGYAEYTDEELMEELEQRDISYLFGENDEVSI